MGQRALARAVRPHDHVDLAALDFEIDPEEDLAAPGRGVETFDHEAVRRHGRITETLPSATVTS